MSKREKIEFKYHDGSLIPASNYARSLLQLRNYKDGQVVRADITKLVNPKFNRLVHKIGQLCIDHIDDFEGYSDAHAVVKRLQIECGAWCEEIGISLGKFHYMVGSVLQRPAFTKFLRLCGIVVGDDGLLIMRVPKSLSFSEIDQENYVLAARQICRHISEVYWPTCTPEQVEAMAEQNAMVNE